MAVFRVEKNHNYTVMSNYHLRDTGLTLKAIGLLSKMLSLTDEWDYTTRGLAAICKEGVDAIGAALKELEVRGYLVRRQIRDSKGRITDTEYTIYESPHTPLPDTASPDTENPYLDIIISDTDDTFNFLASMVYTQLFNLLCDKADDVYGGRLPVHVRCLIDECANIGQIPKLEKLMATIRSREISACLVLQAQSQLKALYKDNCDTIIGNCDSSVFLGGKEPTTLKELSAALGKETIDTFNTGESRGREVSHSLNYQKLGKELMSQDEIAVLNGGKCILQLRGVRPFLSDKYDITKHPNYRYLSDVDPKNAFDIEKFLSTKLKLKPEEEFEVFDAGAAAGSESA